MNDEPSMGFAARARLGGVRALVLVLASLGGCDRDGFVPPRESLPRAALETSAEPGQPGDALVHRGPTSPMGEDWEAWLDRELVRLAAERPALVDALRGLEPRVTRAGLLRFTGPLVSQPDALPILLDRLRRRDEAPAVRAALAEALPRTGADHGRALVALFADEREASVRETMAFALRRVPGERGREGLRLALTDADARVRAEAVRALAHRDDGHELAEAVLAAASDRERDVRLAAAETLGTLRPAGGSVDALRRLALEDDPELRDRALLALRRIDPAEAENLRSQLRSAADGNHR